MTGPCNRKIVMSKIKTSKTGKDTPAKAATDSEDAPTSSPLQTLDPRMVSALLCPKSGAPLIHDKEAGELISKKAKLAYPIREGVPIMLIEEARAL